MQAPVPLQQADHRFWCWAAVGAPPTRLAGTGFPLRRSPASAASGSLAALSPAISL